MSVVEQTPSRGSSRFGKLSSNMFFIRNTAKPKRVRHIEGNKEEKKHFVFLHFPLKV